MGEEERENESLSEKDEMRWTKMGGARQSLAWACCEVQRHEGTRAGRKKKNERGSGRLQNATWPPRVRGFKVFFLAEMPRLPLI